MKTPERSKLSALLNSLIRFISLISLFYSFNILMKERYPIPYQMYDGLVNEWKSGKENSTRQQRITNYYVPKCPQHNAQCQLS